MVDSFVMIDTHTHLNFEAFNDDWQEVVERAISAGVSKMIVVGTDVESSKRAIKLADSHKTLFASVGVHPHHVKGLLKQPDDLQNSIEHIQKLLNHPRVVAVGEIGLDYHTYKQSKYSQNYSEEEWKRLKALQKELLLEQVRLALEYEKPVILHSREANDDVLDVVLADYSGQKNDLVGVFHCFEGSKKYLKRILDAGFFVSLTGNVTYSEDRQQVAKLIPLDRLLLETDSPLLTPEPYRGERNEPAYVKIVAEMHAQSRVIHFNEVVVQTTLNAKQLFHL